MNAKNQRKTDTRDVWARLKTSVDAMLGLTSYEHDAYNNLSRTTDPTGNVIVVEYDKLGHKTALRDPDLGFIEYTVDPIGQVVKQTSPNQRTLGQFTTFKYDSLGRMIARDERDQRSRWYYDLSPSALPTRTCAIDKSCDQLAEAHTLNAGGFAEHRRTHSYDAVGRPKTTITYLDNVYSSTNEYDAWGRPIRQIHKRGNDAAKVFEQRYNDFGLLARIERGALVLWQANTQDAVGRLTSATLGNGLNVSRIYNPRTGRLSGGAVQNVQGLAQLQEGYSYDVLGNVEQRSQYWPGAAGFIETFLYDDLNRLKKATVTGFPDQDFTYDAIGNMLSKTGVGTGNYVYPVPGPGSLRPHAVSSIAGISDFRYDDNGNLKEGAGRTLTWTSFDMPWSIANDGATSTFVYGAEYQRVRQDKSDGTGIWYAGAMEVETKDGVSVAIKTYWPMGLGVEIERAGTTELNWTHRDRIGSVVAISDANGSLPDKLAYDSWGKRRALTGNAPPDSIVVTDNKGFTGHEMLDQLDLVHMNGRIYDPLVARFMSADPIIQDPAHSQSYNRYTYVWNNPTNLTDPTGFIADSEPTNAKTGCDEECQRRKKREEEERKRFCPYRWLVGSGGGSSDAKSGQNASTENQVAGASANNIGSSDGGTPSACQQNVICGKPNRFDKSDPYHHNTKLVSGICSESTLGCTLEGVLKATSRHPAPHNGAGTPVRSGSRTEISFVISGGHVTHEYDPKNFRILNITEQDHKFYDGVVIRSTVREGGVISSVTFGDGVNRPGAWFGLIPNALSKFMNVVTSPVAFSIENRHIQKEILNKSPQGKAILQQQEIRRLEGGYHGM